MSGYGSSAILFKAWNYSGFLKSGKGIGPGWLAAN
jgi:hypothetical protein